VIKMNPVAKTFVQKALKRVVDRERRKGSILLSSIEALAESSSGDLRAAVNALQLHFTDRKNAASKSVTCSHDHALGLLHVVGKFLHPKREEISPDVMAMPPLKFNVENVVASAQAPPRTIMAMIHESYLGVMDDDMDALEQISACISTADTFLSDPLRKRHATNSLEDSFNVYCTSVVARGMCLHKRGKSGSQSMFRLARPVVTQVDMRMRSSPEYIHSHSSLKLHHSPSVLLTEVLPYLALISRAPIVRSSGGATPIQEGNLEPHDRKLAQHLASYSTRGWSKMSDAKGVDRANEELRAIAVPVMVTEDIEEMCNPDPHNVLHDDEIVD